MSFCTAINCMDGRTQLPVNAFMQTHCGADYVDTITEPGPVKMLAEEPLSSAVESILARVKISVDKHGSQCVAVIAHYDCTGNPLPEDRQREQLDLAVRFLASHYPYIEILGLWVDAEWQVHKAFHANP